MVTCANKQPGIRISKEIIYFIAKINAGSANFTLLPELPN